MRKKVQKRSKKLNYTKIVLQIVCVAGIVSIAVLAPNAIQAIAVFTKNDKSNRRYKTHTPKVITRLARQGYIIFEKTEKGTFAKLSEKGKELLSLYELGEYKIPTPKKWDRKFRIIIFDIKEYRRGTRDKLREYLDRLGFVRLQNSVWVYPYNCSEVMTLLKASFRIGRDILYIEADSIENDKWLRKHFELN